MGLSWNVPRKEWLISLKSIGILLMVAAGFTVMVAFFSSKEPVFVVGEPTVVAAQ